MASIVGFINAEAGWFYASIAALKQGIYTFFFGGIIIKLCENLALYFRGKWLAILLATAISTLVTTTAIWGVHNLKGTAKPWESTLATIFLAPPGFLFLAYRKRNSKTA